VVLDVHVVSDLRAAIGAARVSARLAWNGQREHHDWAWVGEVGADTCVRVGQLAFDVPDASGVVTIDLTLETEDHSATNRYESVISR
jgi:hypothetical protein